MAWEAMKQSSSGAGELVNEIAKLPLLLMFVLFVFYFLGGYFLYSSVFAAIGAAVDNETDTQQCMLPVMLPLILGDNADASAFPNFIAKPKVRDPDMFRTWSHTWYRSKNEAGVWYVICVLASSLGSICTTSSSDWISSASGASGG